MKKIISMLMMVAAIALFVGCGSDDDGGSSGGGGGGAYVGEWVNVTSYSENDYYVTVIKLNSNGTGTQTLYHLSEYEAVYDADDFTYSVSGSQLTIKTPKETFTANYSVGTYDGSKFLTATIKGETTTYMEMTSEIRNEINAFHPVPGDVHYPSSGVNPDSGSVNRCWNCSGTGECDWCDSDGYCFMCDGKGWYRYGSDMKGCDYCNDPGYGIIATGIDYKYGDGWCGHCGGTHKCYYCGGKGYID